MQLIRVAKEYLRERQSPGIRFLHIAVLLMVISQIVVSNFAGFDDDGQISKKIVEYYGTWVHIITGLCLVPIALLFVFVELKSHGVKHFFPYLSGDHAQLKNDLMQLRQLTLPEPVSQGIASIVQGLGLGALLLVLLSGLTWFISWRYGASWSELVKDTHELLTGLVIAYIVGHGCMGVLHIFYAGKK